MYQGTVAFLVADEYEDVEFRVPYDRVGRLGTYETAVLGTDPDVTLRGRGRTETLAVDRGLFDARPEDFVALVIPGGPGVARLRADPDVLDWVRRFDATGRTLAAIGDGRALLVAAGIAERRALAAWPIEQEELEPRKIRGADEPVMRDGAWITGRNAGDVDPFAATLVRALRHEEIGAAP